MKLPEKFIIDTNVPLTANNVLKCPEDSQDWRVCAVQCIVLLESIVKTKAGLVLDSNDGIFDEYSHKLSYRGQPGLGDKFFKWLHDNRYRFPEEDRVPITIDGDSYVEFPEHPGLANFDVSDRKFIAVANAHRLKPTIYEATDCKWWGWRTALEEVGIHVHFLGEDYVKRVFKQKFPDHNDV
jgi:hypothetical protein